jgi:hypothetical protein
MKHIDDLGLSPNDRALIARSADEAQAVMRDWCKEQGTELSESELQAYHTGYIHGLVNVNLFLKGESDRLGEP